MILREAFLWWRRAAERPGRPRSGRRGEGGVGAPATTMPNSSSPTANSTVEWQQYHVLILDPNSDVKTSGKTLRRTHWL